MRYLGEITETHADDASAVHAMTVCGSRALQGEEVGSGLLTYPALMAADILLYQVGRAGSKHLATYWWRCDMYKGFEVSLQSRSESACHAPAIGACHLRRPTVCQWVTTRSSTWS
jgi:hypothetical protein